MAENTNWQQTIDGILRNQDALWNELRARGVVTSTWRLEIINRIGTLEGSVRVLATKYGSIGLISGIVGGVAGIITGALLVLKLL